jgi:hypothetical protein
MKVGDKVWVEAEIIGMNFATGPLRLRISDLESIDNQRDVWVAQKHCKPVEPEAFQLRKPNAIFTMQGHVSKGTYGVAKYNGNLWYFESVDGKFKRWCEGQHIELLDQENIELPVKQSPKDDEHCIGNVCDMFEPTGIACPHDSCDIETGVRNPVVQQSMTVEEQPSSDSDYRDATPEDVLLVMQGEKVRAKFKEHDNSWDDGYYHGFLGGWANYDEARRYLDDDGCPWKYCQVYDPKKPQNEPDNSARHLPSWFGKGLRYLAAMSDATVVEVLNNQTKKGLDLLSDFDTVEPGDLFQSSRDGKFHRCNFTVGMPVREAVLRGYKQRETWTFYRPKVQA